MRIIFHIDVNAAFLSWTAAYRCQVLGEQQDLRDIPAAIAGEKANRHGIILAKSLPAKRMGVKTGEPIFQAVKKCPQLVTAPPDYALYTQASRRFIALLRSFTPLVEQYSIDEAWADMTGTERLYGSPVLAARTIKQQIREQLGFTVNIGISSNKLLAKIAGDFEKPDRVHTLFPEEIPEKLWPLPVRELFLVGQATEEKLHRLGIRTIGALAKSDPSLLQRYLHKPGLRLWHYANGRCDDALLPEQPENKGYGNSTTLPADVTDFPQAERPPPVSRYGPGPVSLKTPSTSGSCPAQQIGPPPCTTPPASSCARCGTGAPRCGSSASRSARSRTRLFCNTISSPLPHRSSAPWTRSWIRCASATASRSFCGPQP